MSGLVPRPELRLSPAVPGDLPAILEIYNEVIRNSTAVYSETEFTLERGQSWLETKRELGYPMVVARAAGEVVGFGTFGDFRAWPCYHFTVEHSIHVRADRRGAGIGRALIEDLVERARSMGKHVMIAGIDAENSVSIRLHERLGFTAAGHFHQVGFKFGRWLDLVFYQRLIS